MDVRKRWRSYDPNDNQTIDEWLQLWKPSDISILNVEWLCVSRHIAKKKPEVVDTAGLIVAWESLCLQTRQAVLHKDIERLAVLHNVVYGKWLIFVEGKDVDEHWLSITTAVFNGLLGPDAKVSVGKSSDIKVNKVKGKGKGAAKVKGKGELKLVEEDEPEEKCPVGKHVICVYTEDFRDLQGLLKVRATLREMGYVGKLRYKADAYTTCGVYHDNLWGLSPTMYNG